MVQKKERLFNVRKGFLKKSKKLIFLSITFFTLLSVLHAQTDDEVQSQAKTEIDFPAGNFWSLDAGVGMSGILVEGTSYQIIIDPKLWLSPLLMVGSKVGINYSAETEESDLSNILTFEGQVYMRWNFLRFGKNMDKRTNIFAQLGLGLISAYRGTNNPFNEVTETRGSIMADAALGITIPLSPRWHLEPQIRGGYPHIFGFSLTAGYKFPLPQSKYISNTEYVEVEKTLPATEVVKRFTISAIEFVIFGPDIGSYNVGIDRDAQQLNELLIIATAEMLKAHPEYRVRIEGHANPYTINISEHEELMALSTMRANVVAGLLRDRGVSDDQMTIIAFGGTRNATSEWDVRNRNRRVEIMVFHYDEE